MKKAKKIHAHDVRLEAPVDTPSMERADRDIWHERQVFAGLDLRTLFGGAVRWGRRLAVGARLRISSEDAVRSAPRDALVDVKVIFGALASVPFSSSGIGYSGHV